MNNSDKNYLRTLLDGWENGEWKAKAICERLEEWLSLRECEDELTGRPAEDLIDSGLLWYINRSLFWPDGYSLQLSFEEDELVSWDISGDGVEPITSGKPHDEPRKLALVRYLFREATV